MTDHGRALKRIRKLITEALDWREIAAFAGSGHPEEIDYKEYRAKRARETLERAIQEELENAYRKTNRYYHSG